MGSDAANGRDMEKGIGDTGVVSQAQGDVAGVLPAQGYWTWSRRGEGGGKPAQERGLCQFFG
jgi:hypothetical protein